MTRSEYMDRRSADIRRLCTEPLATTTIFGEPETAADRTWAIVLACRQLICAAKMTDRDWDNRMTQSADELSAAEHPQQ